MLHKTVVCKLSIVCVAMGDFDPYLSGVSLKCLLCADCFIASDVVLKVHISKSRELVHEDGHIPVMVSS